MKKRFLFTMVAILFSIAFCLPMAPASAADSIVIGVPTSLTFVEGKEAMKSVQLAVDEINAKGGVKVGDKMMPFSIASIDIRDAAPGVPVPEALLGLEKLILEKKPHALVVGPFRSEALLAGMDILAKYKTPLLETIAMSPKVEAKVASDPKYKYLFRVGLDAKFFVGYIAGVMKTLNEKFGFTKVYIMNQDVAWARATADIMSKIYGKMGWTIVGHEAFPTGSGDFSPALMKAKRLKAQVILPVFDMPQSGILIKQWRGMRIPAIMAGFVSPLCGDAAWKAFDGKIGGALAAVHEIGNVPAQKYPPAKAFFDAYQAKYGETIQAGHGPAPSYASVYLLKDAIEKAGSLDPDAIVTALEAADTETTMGKVKFTKGHQAIYGRDPSKEALGCFLQWSDEGKRVIVFPPAIAEAEIKLPEWIKPAK